MFRWVICMLGIGGWLVLGGTGCGGGSVVKPAGQYASGLTVDGLSADWNSLSAQYFQRDEAVAGVANDGEHLYVMLRFRNPMYAAAIRDVGLTMWVDPSGGFDKAYVLRYRGGPMPDDESLPDEVRRERRRFATADVLGDSLAREQLTIRVRDIIEEKPVPVGGEEGPLVASGIEQGFFVYEFRVPLGESKVRYYGLGATVDSPVGVGLLWGNQPRPDMMKEMTRGKVFGDDIMEPPNTETGRGAPTGPGGPEDKRVPMREHELHLKTVVSAAGKM